MDSIRKQTQIIRKTWFHQKSTTEKRLILIVVILSLLFLALMSVLVAWSWTQSERNVCLTPKCVMASARLLNIGDFTEDPCNDFYKFSCGNFLRNTIIPEEKSMVSTFSLIRDKVDEQLKAMIEETPDKSAPKQYHFAKKVFNMCMNSTEIEANAMSTVKDVLYRLGGWPLLEGKTWNETSFDWTSLMYKFRKIGIGTNFFLSVTLTSDLRNSSRRVIAIGEAVLDLEREYLINGVNDPIIRAYYDYIVDVAVLFGASKQNALVELKDTLDFEINLAKICLPQEETRNLTAQYNPMRIWELQDKYPFVSWKDLINNVISLPDIRLSNESVVFVDVPQFLVKVHKLLEETPKRVQANYIMRVVANSFVSSMGKQVRDRSLIFNTKLTGQTASKPRWKECLLVARKIGKYPIEASYIRKYFNQESKLKVTEIVDKIRSEFKGRLNSLEWIDDATKKNALEKLDAVTAMVGYPDELLIDKNVEEYYSKLELNSDNYVQSLIDYSTFYSDQHYLNLNKSFDKTDWKQHAPVSVVNAFYSASENDIVLPSGILQEIFFEDDRPQYMNYGAIGSTIAHELIHGFDDIGSQYDKHGNLKDWWGKDTKRSFIEKSKCIIEQYSNYKVPEIGINVNGINTQGENIADSGGVLLSYLAYQQWVRENGPELPLPGLDFTSNQLFWITAAATECTVEKSESLKASVTTGSHSPAIFRVNGAYSNTQYFAKDFKCTLGAKMNPLRRCSVW